ncbi:hypothetical protein [Pararhizobium sp.]|uniref:hypothetical protein n=1 Tax=Pararhizobium sp. TaxID=1977563 RepID=UPI003D0DB038
MSGEIDFKKPGKSKSGVFLVKTTDGPIIEVKSSLSLAALSEGLALNGYIHVAGVLPQGGNTALSLFADKVDWIAVKPPSNG